MKPEPACPRRSHILGWPIDMFDRASLLEFLDGRISSGRKTVLANLNLHALYCLEQSGTMRRLLRHPSTFVHIDGMPIVWALKLKGRAVNRSNRLTYVDWAPDALKLAARRNWKVAFVGSTPETCAVGVRHFQREFPNLEAKAWDGYFDLADGSSGSKLHRLKQEVNAFGPDLLFVGMGMPRQEQFLDLHGPDIQYKVAICAGAFLEYFAGEQSRPPRWLGPLGLEWFYRLLLNPRRYGHRYLVEPLALLMLVVGDRTRRHLRVQNDVGDSLE